MSDLNDLARPVTTDTEPNVLDTIRGHIARAITWTGYASTANKLAGMMSAVTAAVTGGRSLRLYRRNDANTADEEVISLPGISIGGNAATASAAQSGSALETAVSSKVSKTSANRPGVYKLYRNDGDTDYNVQTKLILAASRWRLDGYNGDTFHAGVEVLYADTAGGVAWGNVTGKPSLVANDGGTYGINISGTAGGVAWGNVSGKPFNWSGQAGQPTWLWGSNDGSNYYVWNPSNFSVAYAASAGVATSLLTTTGSAPVYGVRAWVVFDGRNTAVGANIALKAQGNVASVYKNALGDWTITYTNAMPDANYMISGMTQIDTTLSHQCGEIGIYRGVGAVTAGSVRIRTNNGAQSAVDPAYVSVMVVR